ncbi:MAG: hypothetical protein H6Q74_619 [Firmicutes bacterium]|nr:hypothetical protein [Bacillota bacterium]
MRLSPRRSANYSKRRQNETFNGNSKRDSLQFGGYQQQQASPSLGGRENGNYSDTRQEETPANVKPPSSDNAPVDSLITDLAKGFALAQDKIEKNPPDKEMLQLLGNISKQLERLSKQNDNAVSGQANDAKSNSGVESADSAANRGQANVSKEQQAGAVTTNDGQQNEKLQAIIRTLFQENKNNSTNNSIVNGADQGMAQAQANSQNNNNQNDNSVMQTAAQALSQAQYELSEELRLSLNKLKQVIDESEKIANKISVVLDEQNNSQQA